VTASGERSDIFHTQPTARTGNQRPSWLVHLASLEVER
jgi:hypothetical protein